MQILANPGLGYYCRLVWTLAEYGYLPSYKLVSQQIYNPSDLGKIIPRHSPKPTLA
jgi:hypothetical protein